MDAGTTVALVIGVLGFITAGTTAISGVINSRNAAKKNELDATVAIRNLSQEELESIIDKQRETIAWMSQDRTQLQGELSVAKEAIRALEATAREAAARIVGTGEPTP